MSKQKELGKIGEERAVLYLKEKGYEILHTNWRFRHLEIDIVARKNEMLVIVEIKTRSTDYFEHPQEAITKKKIKNTINAAHEYIIQFDWQGETRFDVISIIPKNGTFQIEHIEDAFLSSGI